MADRKLIVSIIGDSRSLERSFARSTASSNKFSKRLAANFAGLGKAGAAGVAVAGTALVTKQLSASVKAAKDAQAASVRLSTAFKNAKVPANQYAKAQAEIARVSKRAALDDEDLSDVLANLTRTTGSAQKGLKGMALAANIARARNISLAAAAKAVEKAHVGQFRGLKAVGVEISKGTTATEALDRAQRKFAGSAAAYGRTASGAQDQLAVAFENLQEKIGAKLLPVLTKLTLKLVELIDWSERNWPKFSAAIQKVADVVRPIVKNMIDRIRTVVEVIRGVVKLVDAIAHGEWSKAWGAFKSVVANQLKLVYQTFLELPGKILKALGGKAWDGLKAIGTAIRDAALSGLTGLKDSVVKALQSAINAMIRLVNKAIAGINKIPFAPDIPKIPELDQQIKKLTTAARKAGAADPTRGLGVGEGRRIGTRAASSVGGAPVVQSNITVNLDSQVVARAVTRSQQKNRRSNPKQKRGPNAG